MTPAGAPASALLAAPGVRFIMDLLNGAGEEARIVGGAVRNRLMGLQASDIDIATTALPDEVLRRAAAASIHAVPTGYEHGTVTLVIDGVAFEVTSLREDIATDGRRATVRFGRDFRIDALRRDFTINALSVSVDGQVHDYCGGLADIAAGRVRFIGDAASRIREDYLRILRFFRFSAAYAGGKLDATGLAACLAGRAGLRQLSRERVRQETMKLLVAAHAVPVIRCMVAHDLLADVLGATGDAAALAEMVELEQRFGLPADAVRRLAALAVRSDGDVERLRDGLRLTNREQAQLSALLDGVDGSASEAGLKAALFRLGMPAYRDGLLFGAACGEGAPGLARALALPERWTPPAFVLRGADVLALGVPKGPEVGRLLAEAETQWIAAGMPEGEAAQLALLAAIRGR